MASTSRTPDNTNGAQDPDEDLKREGTDAAAAAGKADKAKDDPFAGRTPDTLPQEK
jgi:hypothetical protein